MSDVDPRAFLYRVDYKYRVPFSEKVESNSEEHCIIAERSNDAEAWVLAKYKSPLLSNVTASLLQSYPVDAVITSESLMALIDNHEFQADSA